MQLSRFLAGRLQLGQDLLPLATPTSFILLVDDQVTCFDLLIFELNRLLLERLPALLISD